MENVNLAIDKKIAQLIRYYQAVMANFSHFYNLFGYLLFFQWTILILVFINNMYYALIKIINQEEFSWVSMVFQCQIFYIYAVSYAFLVFAEDLAQVVSCFYTFVQYIGNFETPLYKLNNLKNYKYAHVKIQPKLFGMQFSTNFVLCSIPPVSTKL